MPKLIDIIGSRVGMWTVLKRSENGSNGAVRYVCVCDCGTIKKVYATSLLRKKSMSCGCLRNNKFGFVDIGDRFGRLKVMARAEDSKWKRKQYICLCDCGSEVTVDAHSLRAGKTKSCGCYTREATISSHTTHGMSKHPLYRKWIGINRRCYDKNASGYKGYGGRGIANDFCSFEDFYKWATKTANPPWKRGLMIDRMDVNGNYSPDNCRFVTPIVNTCENRRQIGTSKYVGVIKDGRCGAWRARLKFKGKTLLDRKFQSELDAVVARDVFIIKNDLPHPLQVLS